MRRPIAYLIFAVALGLCPAASFAQSGSPGGKTPAGGEEIKPVPGAKGAPGAPGAGKQQPVKPLAAEQPPPKPAGQTVAPKPTAEQPAAQQPAAPTRAAKQVDPEKRTRIREVVKTAGVHPEAHVDFHVSVGVHVPRTVHFYPLPATIVEIVPQYEGYEFFLVGDEIIIVDPETLEIVDVISA